MPDTFQTMATCTNDQRSALPAGGSEMKRSHVITKRLKTIKEVVEILDLGYGPETSHSHSYALPHDRKFTDTGIKDALIAVFGLQTCKALVNVPNEAEIFSESKHRRI